LLNEKDILSFISEDMGSKLKERARVGQRYYEGRHDILNYQLFYFNSDGELVEDKTRSNIKISHPFFTELVDQQVQYMLSGKGAFMRSDDPELQVILDEGFNDNEDFLSELYETIQGTIAKGFDYLYLYKDEDGKMCFQNGDSLGVIEVPAKYSPDGEDHVIYHYVDRIEKNKLIKRVQVWDRKQTYFYLMYEEKLIPDPAEPINPRPHSVYEMNGEMFAEDFGTIPFFRLDNSKKRVSGIESVKALIDDYDLMSCGLSNNLQDASEYLVL
jgi:SPP1 family phage portal protein